MRRRTALALPPAALLASCSDRGADASDASGSTSRPSSSDGGSEASGKKTTPSPSPTPDAAEQRAADLSDEEAAAQLVLVGIPAGTTPASSLISDLRVGGFFLLGIWDSADTVRALVEDIGDRVGDGDVSPLLSVDQEGGQVRMLRGSAARRTPSAATLGEQGTDAVTDAYTSIGEDLAGLGLHAALAPVADAVDPELGSANAPVGKVDRGFGTDPAHVADCVVAATKALDGQQVASALKHFPGLGRVRGNTDFSAEDITDEKTDADSSYLDPFRAGIDAGADMVMLSSALYPRLDEDTPAMFSRPIVTELLRGSMGFDGLVVSDDVGSAAAVQDVPVAERATRLLEAGGDVVLTADPDLAEQLVEAIADWASQSKATARRVRESAARMLRVKQARSVPGA
ncbi:beta-glucosidase [Brachybacterium endophyticum]|uniref:beta-N-acetylhexosaminidase n=1 Tax=Brachybacterium endophyticum TaxID=2182385 RepID=A0A2U2RP69_9MICO|nr:glycoside hydrolase family 3 N-terminal domain-containing protein [Brachybacterium endophyticum]PWH07673.1 beta-glucosidase [Brachybacterium endophyticum]